MILTAYIDESGTHHPSPVMVVGGYVARFGQWRIFDRKWGTMLSRYGLTYHHTTELIGRKNEYTGWSEEKGSRYIDRVTHIAHQNAMFGFVVRIKHEDYKNVYRQKEKPHPRAHLDSEYGVCFRVILSFLPLMLGKSVPTDGLQLHLVLEAGAKGVGDTKRIFDLFQKHPLPVFADVHMTRCEADKKKFYGLQAADSLAYSVFQTEQMFEEQELIDVPAEASLEDAQRMTNYKAPIFRLDATPALLTELRDNLLALQQAKVAWGNLSREQREELRAKPKP